jgi:putative lipoprotein (rSAM/lipoprotein system)
MDIGILAIKSYLIRSALKLLGITSVCFLFEACYGTPQGDFNPLTKLNFTGKVNSISTNLPIDGIEVTLTEQVNTHNTEKGFSDSSGVFSVKMNASNNYNYKLSFRDIDSSVNGEFYPKDTIIDVNMDDINNQYKVTDIKLKTK